MKVLGFSISQPPLKIDPTGVVRVGETRVTLDTVVEAFRNGATCEEIVFQYPVLDLTDVYAVVSYYLQNREAVDNYILEQKSEITRLRKNIELQFPPAGIRQRLLNRKQSERQTSAH